MAELNGNFKLRLVCTLNNLKFQCGLVALGGGAAYILLNKKRMVQAKVKAGNQVEVTLEADTTEYGVPMPETLQAVLENDQEGNARFKALAAGKQRYIMMHIGNFKNTQIQIDKSLFLIENLKRLPKGKESLKAIFEMK